MRKSEGCEQKLILIEEACPKTPRRGWAEAGTCSEFSGIRYVSPLVMLCPQCQGEMRIIAFLTDHSVVDRIINHLKLSFVEAKPPPPHMVYQEVLMAAERGGEYFS